MRVTNTLGNSNEEQTGGQSLRGAVEGMAGVPGGGQLGEPGAEGLSGVGAGGSQESNF